jgi:hypothetical protein
MADLNYKFTGVNTAQLANEVQILRQRSRSLTGIVGSGGALGLFTPAEVASPPTQGARVPTPYSTGQGSSFGDRFVDKPERRLGRSTYGSSPASAFDTGAPEAPLVLSGDVNDSGGLLGMFAALAGSDPNQPVLPDDQQNQANLQALEDRFTSTGNINDAWALYKARTASRR